jgi:hypothetical protein
MNAKACLKGKRSHWGIENRQHWVLDIAFCENIRQVRKDHAPENFAVLRHSAVNLLKQKKKAVSSPGICWLVGTKPNCSRFYPFEIRLPYSHCRNNEI